MPVVGEGLLVPFLVGEPEEPLPVQVAGPAKATEIPLAFRHLPVTSHEDVTHNFEQLIGVFGEFGRRLRALEKRG